MTKKRFDYEAVMPYQDDTYFRCRAGETRDTCIAQELHRQECWKKRRAFLKTLGLKPDDCWVQGGVIQAIRWNTTRKLPAGWKIECRLAPQKGEPKDKMVRLILDGKTKEGRELKKIMPAAEKSSFDFANALKAPWLRAEHEGWGTAQRVRFPHFIILGDAAAAKTNVNIEVICIVPLVRNHQPWIPPGIVDRVSNSRFWSIMELHYDPIMRAENAKFRGGKPPKAKPGHFSDEGRFGDDEA
jgi:hypothetical protein